MNKFQRQRYLFVSKLEIQEVNNMNAIRVYFTPEDIDKIVREKLSADDNDRFKDVTFYPIQIENNNTDLSLEVTFAPVK